MIGACAGSTPTAVEPTAIPEPISNEVAYLIGAGDIADCAPHLKPNQWMAEYTARIIDALPEAVVFTTGDNVYEHGTREEWKCYERLWGRHKSRTRPTPGNHDYYTENAAPYYEYFGENAGPPGLGYYTYDLGGWRIFALNSEVPAGVGSPQYQWLSEQLRSTSKRCVMAYWHHPVFSSGYGLNQKQMRDIWKLLHAFRAELVVSGHGHNYERFAPLDANGKPDSATGIRQIVVGTGGSGFTELWARQPYSEVFNNDSYGVLKLTLRGASYDWEFVPVVGNFFRDSGSGVCF